MFARPLPGRAHGCPDIETAAAGTTRGEVVGVRRETRPPRVVTLTCCRTTPTRHPSVGSSQHPRTHGRQTSAWRRSRSIGPASLQLEFRGTSDSAKFDPCIEPCRMFGKSLGSRSEARITATVVP